MVQRVFSEVLGFGPCFEDLQLNMQACTRVTRVLWGCWHFHGWACFCHWERHILASVKIICSALTRIRGMAYGIQQGCQCHESKLPAQWNAFSSLILPRDVELLECAKTRADMHIPSRHAPAIQTQQKTYPHPEPVPLQPENMIGIKSPRTLATRGCWRPLTP